MKIAFNEWYNSYHYTSIGRTQTPNNSTEDSDNEYDRMFLQPIACICGVPEESVTAEHIKAVLAVVKERQFMYFFRVADMIAKYANQFPADVRLQKLGDAITMFTKGHVAYYIMCKDGKPVVGYVAKKGDLVGAPVTEFAKLGPVSAFGKTGPNIEQIINTPPSLLNKRQRNVLQELNRIGYITESSLPTEEFPIPTETGIVSKAINGLSAGLPSVELCKLISDLPDSLKNQATNPYMAAISFAMGSSDKKYKELIPEIQSILDKCGDSTSSTSDNKPLDEQIKDYMSSHDLSDDMSVKELVARIGGLPYVATVTPAEDEKPKATVAQVIATYSSAATPDVTDIDKDDLDALNGLCNSITSAIAADMSNFTLEVLDGKSPESVYSRYKGGSNKFVIDEQKTLSFLHTVLDRTKIPDNSNKYVEAIVHITNAIIDDVNASLCPRTSPSVSMPLHDAFVYYTDTAGDDVLRKLVEALVEHDARLCKEVSGSVLAAVKLYQDSAEDSAVRTKLSPLNIDASALQFIQRTENPTPTVVTVDRALSQVCALSMNNNLDVNTFKNAFGSALAEADNAYTVFMNMLKVQEGAVASNVAADISAWYAGEIDAQTLFSKTGVDVSELKFEQGAKTSQIPTDDPALAAAVDMATYVRNGMKSDNPFAFRGRIQQYPWMFSRILYADSDLQSVYKDVKMLADKCPDDTKEFAYKIINTYFNT